MTQTRLKSTGLLLLSWMIAASAHAKAPKCTTSVLLADQFDSQYLTQALEHLVSVEAFEKGFQKRLLVREISGDTVKAPALFGKNETADAELFVLRTKGVFDGPCTISLYETHLVNGLPNSPTLVFSRQAQNCARAATYDFPDALKVLFPRCRAHRP